jgi:hypothetical protein
LDVHKNFYTGCYSQQGCWTLWTCTTYASASLDPLWAAQALCQYDVYSDAATCPGNNDERLVYGECTRTQTTCQNCAGVFIDVDTCKDFRLTATVASPLGAKSSSAQLALRACYYSDGDFVVNPI